MSETSTALSREATGIPEHWIIALLFGVQLIYQVDLCFMIGLGPDIVTALGVPSSKIGYMTGTFTIGAALSGFVFAPVLDRLSRRMALTISIAAMSLGILMTGFLQSYLLVVSIRFVVGVFSTPAISIVLALVADMIPHERKGRAISTILSAVPVSVIVLSASLLLVRRLGWHAPYLFLGGCGLLLTCLVVAYIPSIPPLSRARLDRGPRGTFLTQEIVAESYLTSAMFFSLFLITTNATAYYKFNMGNSASELASAFFISGLLALALLPIVGRIVDSFGPLLVCVLSTLTMAVAALLGFAVVPAILSSTLIQSLWICGNMARQTSVRTLYMSGPRARERGKFMSIQTSLQQLSSSLGAWIASSMLSTGAKSVLIGMRDVVALAIVTMLTVPIVVWWTERSMKLRQTSTGGAGSG